MRGRVRFIVAGAALAALCLMLALMSWPYVLGLFVLAGVGWGLWSWLSELERERLRARAERLERKKRAEAERKTPEKGVEIAGCTDKTARFQRGPRKTTNSGKSTPGRKPSNVYQFPVRERFGLDHSSRTEAVD